MTSLPLNGNAGAANAIHSTARVTNVRSVDREWLLCLRSGELKTIGDLTEMLGVTATAVRQRVDRVLEIGLMVIPVANFPPMNLNPKRNMSHVLQIENLHVSVGEKPILRGVNLTMNHGETHALMGPNGSGKSTLGLAIMGHPGYEVTEGSITLDGEDVLEMEPDQRARAGLFMAFQHPMAIPGVKMADFLRHATTNVRNPNRKEGEELIPMREFRKELKEKMAHLRMDVEFARRYVNDGFSGDEMKRAEILQLAMLQPKFAILDETDSGLDADAVRLASESIADIGRKKMGLMIITHHDKLLVHNPSEHTHVMLGGKLVETGGKELAEELHESGYDRIRNAYPDAEAANQEMLAEDASV